MLRGHNSGKASFLATSYIIHCSCRACSVEFKKSMMRFYVSPEYIYPEQKRIEIKDKREVHHIRDVMRLCEGLMVTVFDGKGKEYEGKITDVNRSSVSIQIVRLMEAGKDTVCDITLYQALPKKIRMDFIIEKAVELGVSRIIPMITERTVPGIKVGRPAKTDRWKRIAMAASKQCGRSSLPVIANARTFKDCLKEPENRDLIVFAALDRAAEPLKKILGSSRPASVSVFVGPEGDFSREEIAMVKDRGYPVCSLGPLVLRVETAAIYILSCLNYEYS